MKAAVILSLLLLTLLVLLVARYSLSKREAVKVSSASRRPDLAYYEAINKIGPPQDPQILFLLMAEYSNANKQAEVYHRIDIHQASRSLVVRHHDRIIAETKRPIVLYESGFAPRWYVPRSVIGEPL